MPAVRGAEQVGRASWPAGPARPGGMARRTPAAGRRRRRAARAPWWPRHGHVFFTPTGCGARAPCLADHSRSPTGVRQSGVATAQVATDSSTRPAGDPRCAGTPAPGEVAQGGQVGLRPRRSVAEDDDRLGTLGAAGDRHRDRTRRGRRPAATAGRRWRRRRSGRRGRAGRPPRRLPCVPASPCASTTSLSSSALQRSYRRRVRPAHRAGRPPSPCLVGRDRPEGVDARHQVVAPRTDMSADVATARRVGAARLRGRGRGRDRR